MLVHVGPVDATQMDGWLRFARRVLCNLHTEPGDLGSRNALNLLAEWNALLDEWARQRTADQLAERAEFIWERQMEPDKAEYLLHSLQRTLRSSTVATWVTEDDLATHGMVTLHVLERFVESLENQGDAHSEYVAQMRSEVDRFGASIPTR